MFDVYIVGSLSCDEGALADVLGALNYLRGCGVKVACDRMREGAGGRALLPLMCKGDPTRILEDVLAGCELRWRRVRPSLAEPGSIDVVRRIEACDFGGREIELADVLPASRAADPFEGIVGLERQRRVVRRVADAVSAFGRDALECLSCVFVGEPGTGKTELARRLAAYCGQRGVNSGSFTQVSAADLISSHVGETPQFVRRAFDRAAGGVLFVDEAYALTDGKSNDFGVEAANALVECMDARRREVMVVAAGYEAPMERFLASNPGLRGRFAFRVAFDGYDDTELARILLRFAEEKGFAVGEAARSGLPARMARLRGIEGFAQARTARSLFDRAVLAAAQAHPDVRELREADLDEATAELAGERAARAVGFA